MPAAKQDTFSGPPAREYPTEWTWYPGDEEDDTEQDQRAVDQDNQAVTPWLPARAHTAGATGPG